MELKLWYDDNVGTPRPPTLDVSDTRGLTVAISLPDAHGKTVVPSPWQATPRSTRSAHGWATRSKAGLG
jgi:hypothetical protein